MDVLVDDDDDDDEEDEDDEEKQEEENMDLDMDLDLEDFDLGLGDDELAEEEVKEMFSDIGNGKDYITISQLRTWDELQELIESGLASKKTIDGYISKLGIKDDKLDLDDFTRFIGYLDQVRTHVWI